MHDEFAHNTAVIEKPRSRRVPRTLQAAMPATVIGRLIALDARGEPLVAFPTNVGEQPVPARRTIDVSAADIGREALLMFEDGDPARPILIGLLQTAQLPVPSQAEVDGEIVTLEAHREIVLRCGRASITLTRAGKVLIHGTYISSRSSGANRIKGGSVQIN
jgi:hypothetical protein